MANRIFYGSLNYPTKEAARKAFSDLLRDNKRNQPIEQPWHDALQALLENHPKAAEKIGVGVRHFEVRELRFQGKFAQIGFFIVRQDDTEIDFSYRLCFSGKESYYWHRVVDAAREAIHATCRQAKLTVYSRGELVRCAETGDDLAWEDADVDHAHPWPFRAILEAWMKERGYSRENPPAVTGMEQMKCHFVDPEVAASFKIFHDERAVLRIVHRDINQNRTKTKLAIVPLSRPVSYPDAAAAQLVFGEHGPRRCDYPSCYAPGRYGFGPPGWGQQHWSCRTHRDHFEALAKPGTPNPLPARYL